MDHKELDVWKEAIEFVVAIYRITENFPKIEVYGLTNHSDKVLSVFQAISLKERQGILIGNSFSFYIFRWDLYRKQKHK